MFHLEVVLILSPSYSFRGCKPTYRVYGSSVYFSTKSLLFKLNELCKVKLEHMVTLIADDADEEGTITDFMLPTQSRTAKYSLNIADYSEHRGGKVGLTFSLLPCATEAQKSETNQQTLVFTGVHFQDRCCRWHLISRTFTAYFYVMIQHWGIPRWHYKFTDIGLSGFDEVFTL